MADPFNNVWVDSSFFASAENIEDEIVDFVLADSDNIGIYTVPTTYEVSEPINNNISTYLQYTTTSTVVGEYDFNNEFSIGEIKFTVLPALTEYMATTSVTSGTVATDTLYTTGYNLVSGTVDGRISFISGNTFYEYLDFAAQYVTRIQNSGIESLDTFYTNFSYNYSEPVLNTFISKDVVYNSSNQYFIGSNTLVDISFAGWVEFGCLFDVISAEVYKGGYTVCIDTIDGGVIPQYIEVYSSDVGKVPINNDLYCVLEDYVVLNTECNTISGGLYFNNMDLYSTVDSKNPLIFDVDLLSLKITNFSLGAGEYTNSSNILSVDILDDEYLVSVSGTYLMVDGQQVSTTMSGITDGYRMFYDPEDDYTSLTGPTIFTVHAENENNTSLEQEFYLTFGYVVEFNNSKSEKGINYGFNNKVSVRVTAENFASCPVTKSLAYTFESKNMYSSDLSASIKGVTVNDGKEQSDLTAEVYPISTAYYYGKEFEVVVTAKDFAGNEMEPLVLCYKIEDKPI